MQAMKDRGIKHVRNQTVGLAFAAGSSEERDSLIDTLLKDVQLYIHNHAEKDRFFDTKSFIPPPGTNYPFFKLKVKSFIEQAHNRDVATMKFHINENLDRYEKLHSELPDSCSELPEDKSMPEKLQLLRNRHDGEIVEVDKGTTTWILGPKLSDSIRADAELKQLWCFGSGNNVASETRSADVDEFGRPRFQAAEGIMHQRIQELAVVDTGIRSMNLDPAWDIQQERLTVPCIMSQTWHWYRVGPVITLGELFSAFGHKYTAKEIYRFYLSRRLVVVKRDKHSKTGSIDNKTSSTIGIGGSALETRNIIKEFEKDQELLIKEFMEVQNIKDDAAKRLAQEGLFHRAVLYICGLLIRDLQPPWVLDRDLPPPWVSNSPFQAMPEGDPLSQLIGHSLLQWEARQTKTLFGDKVHDIFAQSVHTQGLEFAGIVARPLFCCTSVVDKEKHELCMRVPSLLRFVNHPQRRPRLKCSVCIAAEGETTAGKSLPAVLTSSLRVLLAYPFVVDEDGERSPVQGCSALRLVVHVPPVSWGRYVAAQHVAKRPRVQLWSPAHPEEKSPDVYWFNAKESRNIWSSSTRFTSDW